MLPNTIDNISDRKVNMKRIEIQNNVWHKGKIISFLFCVDA